jgi:hypothetical protein
MGSADCEPTLRLVPGRSGTSTKGGLSSVQCWGRFLFGAVVGEGPRPLALESLTRGNQPKSARRTRICTCEDIRQYAD